MLDHVEWLFFDVGSTLVDEHIAYEHRLRDISLLAVAPFESVYQIAMRFYCQNQKGDLEAARHFHVEVPVWYSEDEFPYPDAAYCLEKLSRQYRIGIIANQSRGTKERLRQYGLLPYIQLVISSAEEGVAKPDLRIFELALQRSSCRPERAVMIGDRIDNDILPAKQMGMHTVWM